MARKIVTVDESLRLPPEVEAALKLDLDIEFNTYISQAADSASAAGSARAQAEAWAELAEQYAQDAQAPTDQMLANVLEDPESLSRQAVGRLIPTTPVSAYGAVGDGVADDAPAIQAGIDDLNANGGGVLYFAPGVYRIAQTLDLKSNVTLKADGKTATIDFRDVPKAGASRYGIRARGVVGDPVALNSNAAKGGLVVGVDDASTLAPGQWVVVGVDGSYYSYGGAVNVARGEIKQIRSITATPTIGFEQVIYDQYSLADNPFIAPIEMVENIHIDGLRFIGSDIAGEGDRAVVFEYVNNFSVRNCDFIDSDVYAFTASSCIRGDVTGNLFRGVHYDGVTGGVFYAVTVLDATQWVRVSNNHGERVRHVFVTSSKSAGQGHWGYPRFITCVNNVAQNMMVAQSGRSWAYEHHGFGDGILIANNIADGCFGGFVTRGPGVTFEGNIVRNWYQNAIDIHSQTVDARNIIVKNNQISQRLRSGAPPNPQAISIKLGMATVLQNVVIEGNVIEIDATADPDYGAIMATGTINGGGLTIRNNKITWTGSGKAPTYVARIYVPDTLIDGNEVINADFGFRVSGERCVVRNHRHFNSTTSDPGTAIYVEADRVIVVNSIAQRIRRCVQGGPGSTNMTLIANVGESPSDPFVAAEPSGLQAKVNVAVAGTTTINN